MNIIIFIAQFKFLAGEKLYWTTFGSNDPDKTLVLMKNSGWKFDHVPSTTTLPFICQTGKDQGVSKSKEPSRKVGVVTSILIEFKQFSTLLVTISWNISPCLECRTIGGYTCQSEFREDNRYYQACTDYDEGVGL